MSFSTNWRLDELTQDKPVKVFSTFSCGGGSSMGYKRAGFDVIGSCEIDEEVNRLYLKNLHPRLNYVMDLREFNKIPDEDLPPELFDLDILDGSPPCSTFSMAGDREEAWGKEKTFREGQKKQRLDDLFFVYLDTVEKLRPRIAVAENVEGMLRGNARGYVHEIIARFKELGYRVQLFKLNAAEMNVPQARVRVFFIATREDFPPLALDFHERPIPFGEIRSKEGKEVKGPTLKLLLDNRRPGDKDLGVISERVRGLRSCFTLKLVADDQVANTLVSGSAQYRCADGLEFSDEDYRRMSTFPEDYDFGDQSAHYVCGMCVPPNMMANIAAEIWTQWLEPMKGKK